MNTMNRVKTLVVGVALAFGAGAAQADLINVGFETGDFTGWTAVVPVGGIAQVQSTAGAGGITPLFGTYMAHLKTDGPGSYTTLSQSIFMGGGAMVSGNVNWYDAELASSQPAFYNDNVAVQIYNSANALVSTAFYDQHSGNTTIVNGWAPWSYTASAADTYKVVYKITNIGDSIVDSHAYFDGVKVPEPGTLALLGLGLAGLGFLRRRKA